MISPSAVSPPSPNRRLARSPALSHTARHPRSFGTPTRRLCAQGGVPSSQPASLLLGRRHPHRSPAPTPSTLRRAHAAAEPQHRAHPRGRAPHPAPPDRQALGRRRGPGRARRVPAQGRHDQRGLPNHLARRRGDPRKVLVRIYGQGIEVFFDRARSASSSACRATAWGPATSGDSPTAASRSPSTPGYARVPLVNFVICLLEW
jgi:hypothetical protein